jgi:hypothetical protein
MPLNPTQRRVTFETIEDGTTFLHRYGAGNPEWQSKHLKERADLSDRLRYLQEQDYSKDDLATTSEGKDGTERTLQQVIRRIPEMLDAIVEYEEEMPYEATQRKPRVFLDCFGVRGITCVEVGSCMLDSYHGETVWAGMDANGNIHFKINGRRFVSQKMVAFYKGISETGLRNECTKRWKNVMVSLYRLSA